MKSKILFIINEYSFFKSHRHSLILELSKYYNIEIITDLRENIFDSEGIASCHNIKFKNLNKRQSSYNPIKFFKFLIELRKKIITSNPDFIFYVSLENCLIGSLISKSINPRKIFLLVTGIGSFLESKKIKRKFLRKFHKICYRYFLTSKHKFIFQNFDDQNDLTKYFNLIHSEVIEGNGIDAKKFMYSERFDKNNNREIKFLFAANLQGEKGINEYVKAAIEIEQKGYNCLFSIAGKYNSDDRLSISKQEYNFISSHPKLNFLGEIAHSEMPEALSEHDVFVLPSYREGLPLVAIEAAATGMPLILSNVPGCKSLMNNPINGFVVKARSSKSLIKAIEKVFKKKSELMDFGLNSRKLVEKKFLIERIVKKYLQLLHS